MSLPRERSQPLYLQVAQLLEQDIARGRSPPYSRLMSESALMKRFEVSRVTVRAAIMRLVRKGLVDVRQGKGTFVAGPILHQGLDRLSSLYEILAEQGCRPDRRLLDYRPATDEERDGSPFAGAGAPPLLLRRLYLLHDKPFCVIHALLSPRFAGVPRSVAANQTIVDMLNGTGGGVANADLVIRSRPVAAPVGTLLGMPRRRPVLVMERTSYASDGGVLDFSNYYIGSEAWEFRLAMEGPAKPSGAPGGGPGPRALTP
ncbi:MAG TPA: GntR family transcriptional regulator [Casimicrobiaceae bacterium]